MDFRGQSRAMAPSSLQAPRRIVQMWKHAMRIFLCHHQEYMSMWDQHLRWAWIHPLLMSWQGLKSLQFEYVTLGGVHKATFAAACHQTNSNLGLYKSSELTLSDDLFSVFDTAPPAANPHPNPAPCPVWEAGAVEVSRNFMRQPYHLSPHHTQESSITWFVSHISHPLPISLCQLLVEVSFDHSQTSNHHPQPLCMEWCLYLSCHCYSVCFLVFVFTFQKTNKRTATK